MCDTGNTLAKYNSMQVCIAVVFASVFYYNTVTLLAVITNLNVVYKR